MVGCATAVGSYVTSITWSSQIMKLEDGMQVRRRRDPLQPYLTRVEFSMAALPFVLFHVASVHSHRQAIRRPSRPYRSATSWLEAEPSTRTANVHQAEENKTGAERTIEAIQVGVTFYHVIHIAHVGPLIGSPHYLLPSLWDPPSTPPVWAPSLTSDHLPDCELDVPHRMLRFHSEA